VHDIVTPYGTEINYFIIFIYLFKVELFLIAGTEQPSRAAG
jgi:hypothetical protein